MKTRNAICNFCGKEFTTTKMAQKYCSPECSSSIVYYVKKNKALNDTICWDCKNACGNCSWSRSFIPVEGWKAEKRTIATARKSEPEVETYRILYCPEFERG